MQQRASRSPSQPERPTIYEFLSLPAEKRRILRWMQKQPPCSIKSLITFLNLAEEVVYSLVDDLQQQGFICAIATQPETLYRVSFTSARHGRYRQCSKILTEVLAEEG